VVFKFGDFGTAGNPEFVPVRRSAVTSHLFLVLDFFGDFLCLLAH
jgi:hypothetical protein